MEDGARDLEILFGELFWAREERAADYSAGAICLRGSAEVFSGGWQAGAVAYDGRRNGIVGERCEFQLRDAGKLTGRVLAITSREVTVSWDEIGGVLELKAFSMGPQRVVCLRGFSWRLKAEEMAEIEQKLQRALERLAALFPLSAAAGDATLPGRMGGWVKNCSKEIYGEILW